MQQIENRLNSVKQRFNESTLKEDKKHLPLIDDVSMNLLRRKLYSEVELVRLDYEELLVSTKIASTSSSNNNNNKTTHEIINEDLDMLGSKLRLVPIKRKAVWWKWIDIIFRFIGVCATIFSAGVYISIALIIIRGVEEFLQVDPYVQLSVKIRKFVVWYILSVTGISVEIIRPSLTDLKNYFKSQCALLTFSHASNLDGFLVSLTCPIRHVALAKKELFVVPFFAWISLAIGGMPVDRENRERAVEALQRSTEAVKNGKVSIVIAPEGTRSTTGQLLPFKKGPFHLWEQLKCPIIPFVIHGAWDLYPVGSLVNNTGKVVVEYLKPIFPEAGADRDSVLRLVSAILHFYSTLLFPFYRSDEEC